jgi:hypothetical protein
VLRCAQFVSNCSTCNGPRSSSSTSHNLSLNLAHSLQFN